MTTCSRATASVLAVSLLFALGACKKIEPGQGGAPANATPSDIAIPGLETNEEQAGYAIGLRVGGSLAEVKDDVDFDAVVKAMDLPEYPQPEVRELGPDDAPSILLDPSRTFEDFGEIEFSPLSTTVGEAVAYYREFGVSGGYTHLKHDEKK